MIVLNGTTYTSTIIKTPHGFGTKQTGDGRELTTLKKEIGNYKMVIPRQTHSSRVVIITKEDVDNKNIIKAENCDALVTCETGVALTIVTADCVPMIYYDPVAHIVGISHQGWKGTLANLPGNVINKMEELGSNIKDIHVSMGPAINYCCYPIAGERQELFVKKFGGYLSLYHSNIANLINSNIEETNIDIFPFCTSCDYQRFYSYKRDLGIHGEQLSFIIQ